VIWAGVGLSAAAPLIPAPRCQALDFVATEGFFWINA